jgi:UDP-N-acetylmuramate dehydrogenase
MLKLSTGDPAGEPQRSAVARGAAQKRDSMIPPLFPHLPPMIGELARAGAVEVIEHEPLARHVSMGVGGPARWLVTVQTREALGPALEALRNSAVPWILLGGGSNTFFADEGYGGAVVKLGRAFRSIEPGPGPHQLTAGAGAILSAVMNAAKRASLAGLEWAAGVPGTLGGALVGNAGTALSDACTALDRVEVIDAQGRCRTLHQGEFAFGYRHSSLGEHVILAATYNLRPDDPQAIQARIDAGLAKRREQPLGQRCSGCMFKNPPGDAAGRLIDAAGLKGLAIGGASVAHEHANFIVNDGTATAADIMALVDQVRRRVQERWGVMLELEIRMVKS